MSITTEFTENTEEELLISVTSVISVVIFPSVISALMLFMSERDERIDACGAPGGQQRGGARDSDHQT